MCLSVFLCICFSLYLGVFVLCVDFKKKLFDFVTGMFRAKSPPLMFNCYKLVLIIRPESLYVCAYVCVCLYLQHRE